MKKIGFKDLYLNRIFLWDNSGAIIEHFQFFQKNFFESNFCSRFIKDSITKTPRNVKKSKKCSQKVLKIDFR